MYFPFSTSSLISPTFANSSVNEFRPSNTEVGPYLLASNSLQADGEYANGKHDIFSYFLQENRLCHLMHIISLGDNLHEMSAYFLVKIRKIFQNDVC